MKGLIMLIMYQRYCILGNIHLTLKGGGGYGFMGRKKFLSANLIEKKMLSLKWAEKILC